MSLKISPVLCLAGIMNNYAYVITDTKTGTSAVVDASEARPIIDYCTDSNINPQYIFVTHHHEDHTGGNIELKYKYGLQIVVPELEKNLIPGSDIALQNGDVFKFGEQEAQIISVAGHTKGHILWYFPQAKALFTGDTLFNLCIGGLFEGTPEQMWDSLQKIKNLPDDVQFYQGHEYTRANINTLFNSDSQQAQQYLHLLEEYSAQGKAWTGISLALEKACNPYLKIDNKADFVRLFKE